MSASTSSSSGAGGVRRRRRNPREDDGEDDDGGGDGEDVLLHKASTGIATNVSMSNNTSRGGSSSTGNNKRNAATSSSSAASAGSATGGVADYFAILGVGERLVWKHAQKRLQQQQMRQQMQQGQQREDPAGDQRAQEDDEGEEIALMEERFLREIVDAAVVGGGHPIVAEARQKHLQNQNRQGPSHQLHHHQQETASEASSGATVPATHQLQLQLQLQRHPAISAAPPNPSPEEEEEAATEAEAAVSGGAAAAAAAAADADASHSILPEEAEGAGPPPAAAAAAADAEARPAEDGGDGGCGDNVGSGGSNDDEDSKNAKKSSGVWEVIQMTLPASQSPTVRAKNSGYYNQQHFAAGGGNNSAASAAAGTSSQQSGFPGSAAAAAPPTAPTILSISSSNTMTTMQTAGIGNGAMAQAAATGGGGGVPTAAQQQPWSRFQVWNANLDWTSGLYGQLLGCSTGHNHHNQSHHPDHHPHLRHQQQQPLKGLRRKVESTLRNWRALKGEDGDEDDDGIVADNDLDGSSNHFYLALKRRHPVDDGGRPALAQVELCYARVHRSCCLSQPSDGEDDESVALLQLSAEERRAASLASDGGSSSNHRQPSLPGLAGQLLERYQSAKQARRLSSPREQEQQREVADDEEEEEGNGSTAGGDSQKLIPLQEFLTLPEPFEEWSIPQEFAWIRDPYSVMVADWKKQQQQNKKGKSKKNQKTVFFAAHGQGDSGDGGEAGIEAVQTVASGSPTESELRSDTSESLASTSTARAAAARRDLERCERYYVPKLVLAHQQQSQEGDPPPFDDEEAAPGGFSPTDFVHVPVLAIRRQRISDEERYHERDTAIVDLTVSFADHQGQAVLPDITCGDEDDDEFEDEAGGNFRMLGKTEWAAASSSVPNNNDYNNYTSNGKRPRFGFPVVLARKNLPFGFADAAFATSVLDRFPLRNYKNLPLPEEELPMFCYPTGCRLHRAQFSDAPLAEYYGFVVKNERGDSIYVSCVSFMEPLTNAKAQQLALMSEKRSAYSLPHRQFCERRKAKGMTIGDFHLTDFGDGGNLLMTGFDDMTTFEKKTICLVSRYPFWTAFRKFLSHLHILSTSTSELPLERYISHLLLAVPLPKPGGHSVIIPLPALNDPMVLYRPPDKDFPLVDLPYQRLVACLDVKTIVTIVLGLLALERKVIVLSSRPSLVLDVCELLRSLLFPFELCAPYVPRLTEPFQSSLEFPGALFVGIHKDGAVNGLAERVLKVPPEDSILVDLDTGEVDCDGDRYEVISKTWELIPATARTVLVSELETLCRDACIVDGQEPLDSQYDSAFDVALPAAVEDFGVVGGTKEPLDDRAIRDAFLRFFCAVLGGYDRYLVVPDADFLVSGNEWFDSQGFLASVPSERAPYLGALVSTQLFQSFIQRRTEASDVHCLMFDECITEYHSSPVPYGRLGGDVETVASFDNNASPQLLYSLLVDQSATLPPDQLVIANNRSMDASEAGSSLNLSKASISLADYSIRYGEAAFNTSGDLVTAPSHLNLPIGKRFMYCVDGNPCFPHRMNLDLFFPLEPESWVVEMSNKGSSNPLLARSERELEDANRRRRKSTSYRGLNQRRCLWQLPKLMGSHFLGAWLLCIPVQVSQKWLTHDQQTRYLMRALGALRLLRSKQRIVPDEAAYRAMMVACGRTRDDRRVELVKLFGLLRSDGIFPSAVTLGQYTKALAEGYSKRSTGTTQEDDYGGVEVTESASKIGRLSVASINVKLGARDMESALSGLDTSLGILESHGRRWRHRNGILPGETKADQKKRSLNKTWLPVVYSTSFVPKTSDRQNDSDIGRTNVRFVAMWSRTRGCSNCTYVPLEEEIQAGWDVVGGENETVACPRCGALIVPMLGYKEMSLKESLAIELRPESVHDDCVADFGMLPPQIGPSVDVGGDGVSYVAYVSPAALRASLERYVEEHGEEVLARDHLKELDPEVFYNFWWYCARFSLPLPLPVPVGGDSKPLNYCAFAAWDRSAAERGCLSAAKVLSPILDSLNNPSRRPSEDELDLEAFDEVPLLSRFNLQGFYSTVWDHVDLSAILVKLVEACDKRDFKPVVEAVLECNRKRREKFDPPDNDANSDVNSAFGGQGSSDAGSAVPPQSAELDVYRTILYLAKYQCTTAFHAFFPAVTKPCKGYHFWCAIGTPSPIFDRLLRDAAERIRTAGCGGGRYPQPPAVVAPAVQDVSDVAVGFRCVFGHLI